MSNEIKDKMLPPYIKFPSHKVAQHGEFHFLFFSFGHSGYMDYLLGTKESYDPSAQHMCKIVQSFYTAKQYI